MLRKLICFQFSIQKMSLGIWKETFKGTKKYISFHLLNSFILMNLNVYSNEIFVLPKTFPFSRFFYRIFFTVEFGCLVNFFDWTGFETLLRKPSICKVPGVFSRQNPTNSLVSLAKLQTCSQSKNRSNSKLHGTFLGSSVLEKLKLEREFRTLEAKISRNFQIFSKTTEENYKLFSTNFRWIFLEGHVHR
jgi:hypothetical protein